MALFKAVVWALIFLTKLRFPPGVSIASDCFIVYIKCQLLLLILYMFMVFVASLMACNFHIAQFVLSCLVLSCPVRRAITTS